MSLSAKVEKTGCFAPVKRLIGKIISEMTYNTVSSGTLNATQLNATFVLPNHLQIAFYY